MFCNRDCSEVGRCYENYSFYSMMSENGEYRLLLKTTERS